MSKIDNDLAMIAKAFKFIEILTNRLTANVADMSAYQLKRLEATVSEVKEILRDDEPPRVYEVWIAGPDITDGEQQLLWSADFFIAVGLARDVLKEHWNVQDSESMRVAMNECRARLLRLTPGRNPVPWMYDAIDAFVLDSVPNRTVYDEDCREVEHFSVARSPKAADPYSYLYEARIPTGVITVTKKKELS